VVRSLEQAEQAVEDAAGAELGRRVVRPLWLELQADAMKRLDATTIEELCTRAHQAGIAGEYAERYDYTI
jgi:Rrf2 family transcriptional regulator, iron-sulfur cluster assembly transcription factor